MSKELYIACHEALIEEYLEAHEMDGSNPDDWQWAYEETAGMAWERMREQLADRADMERKRRKEG